MKIVLFGSKGQLGWELKRTLRPLGELCAVDREELNLQDAAALESFLREQRPQVIVNASAYTAVDRAEQEQELAFQVNERAPGVMAETADSLHAAFIHVSTDYVFDGELGRPYVESDKTRPLNTYGRSKLAGEQAIQKVDGAYLIFRTAWVYDLRSDNFVTKVLAWARRQETLRIVDDQVSNPTWARWLAETITILLDRTNTDLYEFVGQHAGLYHLAAGNETSRFEWAQMILRRDPQREEQVVQTVQPARSEDFPSAAERPRYSALNSDLFYSVFGLKLPKWEDQLIQAMA